jgi:FixJ family two-component response regulator
VIDDVEAVLNSLAGGQVIQPHSSRGPFRPRRREFSHQTVDVVIVISGCLMTIWDVSRHVMKACLDRGVPKTPFALLTGWGDQIREIEKMKSAGVDRIITKPINISQAVDAIQALVRARPNSA